MAKYGMSYDEAKELAAAINGREDHRYAAGTPDRRCGGLGKEQGKPENFYYVVPVVRRWWRGKEIYIKDAAAFAALVEMDRKNPHPRD